MPMRGIRGAITVEHDSKQEIWQAGQELVPAMLEANGLVPEDIGAVICTMTEDLKAAFPTTGIRQLPGYQFVPLFDARQCAVEGTLPRCIRVLLLAETELSQKDIRHIYLGEAERLRPDLARSK